MKNSDKTDKLGQVGEKIIRNTFSDLGYKITDSIDIFDSKKDFHAVKRGKKITVETKTEVPFVEKCALSIEEKQRKKCWNVDKLVFVAVPPNVKFKYAGYIYEVDAKKAIIQKYRTRKGKKMILFPFEQKAVKVIRKLTRKELIELKKYKISKY